MTLYLKTSNGLLPVGGNGAYMNVSPLANLPMNSSFVAASNGLTYRKFGDEVEITGGTQWTGGTSGLAEQIFGILPVGFRPPAIRRFTGWQNNTGIPVRLTADPGGNLTLSDSLASTRSWEIYMRFPLSTAGQVPTYSDVPSSDVTFNTAMSAQVLAAATWTKLNLGAFIDNIGGFSVSSHVVTIPVTGYYLIDVFVNASTPIVLSNATIADSQHWFVDTNTTTTTVQHTTKIAKYVAGDTFSLWGYNRGSSATVNTSIRFVKIN